VAREVRGPAEGADQLEPLGRGVMSPPPPPTHDGSEGGEVMFTNDRAVMVFVAAACAFAVAVLVFGLLRMQLQAVEDRMELIRCEQWGGRFEDPCSSR
jgi:hypothetical protein